MSVSQQISELIERGMTQELIRDKSAVNQWTVSRLATGATKEPKYKDAKAIDELYQFVVVEGNHWDNYTTNEAENA